MAVYLIKEILLTQEPLLMKRMTLEEAFIKAVSRSLLSCALITL